MKTTKRGKPNGKIDTTKPRQPKKAVGHDKRVLALKKPSSGRKREDTTPERVSETTRTQANRVNNRKPAYDGTPNYTAPQTPTPADIGDSPITIDEGLAAGQLRELAELQADVNKATTAYNVKKDAAKVAKDTVDSKTNLLLEKLRMFTHPTALPLFDQKIESRAVTQMKQGEMVPLPVEDETESEQPELEAAEPEPKAADGEAATL